MPKYLYVFLDNIIMNENDNHLPVYGVGPFLIAPIVGTALLFLILSYYSMIPVYKIDSMDFIFLALGIFFILCGIIFWILAVTSRIDEKIKANQLETTGVYSIIRHPIYAAFLYISIGLILISGNASLLGLIVVYWAFLTYALKNTEEKWLIDCYGDDYINYSKKVNRFFPKVI